MTSGLQEFPANFGASPRFPTSEPLTGLDALAAESHFAQQRQQQQLSLQHQQQALALAPPRQDRTLQPSTVEVAGSEGRKSKKELGATQKPAKTSSGPVRRRISRACDQCNQLRTKCDGEFPCAHCKEYGLTCEYARERKKRGKASRKELATQDGNQQDAAANLSDSVASVTTPLSSKSGSELPRIAAVTSEPHNVHAGVKRRRSGMSAVGHETTSETNFRRTNDGAFAVPQHPATANASNPRAPSVADSVGHMQPNSTSYGPGSAPAGSMYQSHNPRLPFGSVDFSAMDGYHRSVLQHSANVNGQNVLHANNSFPAATSHLPQYPSNQYVAPSPPSQAGGSLGQIRYSDSPASGRGPIANSPHGNSPAWLDLPSPSASLYASLQQTQTQQNLRYPVLRQILPRISSIIPISLACDLLDIYFASSSSTFVRPASPYILGFVLRKRSVLRQTEPRQCSPALLASMLWVAAQTSESSYLTSPPSQRGKICHQLLELTLALFKPLVHTSASDQAEPSTRAVANGVAIGGFGIANPAAGHDTEGGSPGATAALDDVITYINLATVISASEYKAASLRWWNAAWSLARELKLGRELTPNPPQEPNQNGIDVNDGNNPFQNGTANRSSGPHFSEEVREERRRIWWLLYIVDRHLALCYNRPLFLMDVECEGLLQPEDDSLWQLDEFYNPPQFRANIYSRVGPGFECIGHSMFGYFLPLMTMLGEVVDIKHAKQHPRFGLRFRNPENWLDQVTEVNSQLEAYGRSLKDFEDRFVNSAQAAQNAPDLASPPFGAPNQLTSAVPIPRMTETALQTRIVVAYGTHLMHTLHVLAHTKWDPIDLLDDNDQWISSGASFIDATGHAVAAADAINDILEYDPDLSFMPFFFGIYLLQGSFLLLLIADKLGGQASEAVVRACEAIVRAHEVCVVTLNTEYQRNFRNVMRSALAQVKGRTPIDFGERGQRRREVLALYRWTGDGTGLAL